MNRCSLRLSLLIGCLCAPTQVLGQSVSRTDSIHRADSLRVIEKMKADSRRNFSAWPGLVLYCRAEAPKAARLCDTASKEAKYLASLSDISLDVATSWFSFFDTIAQKKSLGLVMSITGTKAASGPVALNVYLRASARYDRAVEEGGTHDLPRTGELVLWENAAIGASDESREALVSGMSPAVESLLKQFFADYVESRRSGK